MQNLNLQSSRRIGVVIYDFDGRGVQKIQIKIANELISRGYVVDALIFFDNGPLKSHLDDGVNRIYMKSRSVKYSLAGLIKYILVKKPMIILSAEDHINVLIILAKILTRSIVKISVSCRVSPNLWAHKSDVKNRILRFLVASLYSQASLRVMLSNEMADDYSKIFKLERDKLSIIHNPAYATLNKKYNFESHPWLIKKNIPVIIGVGNLSTIKGFDVLILAVFKVLTVREIRLLIVGDGPERNNLQSLIKNKNLSNSVSLIGYHPNPEFLIQQSDLFVLCSRSEGFGNVLVEAISVGCPVISTRCGGGPLEIMEYGRLGPLVDPGDFDGLANKIIEVIDHPISSVTLQKSAERFKAESIVQQYLFALGMD
jgi:glycosyltransferase involved in cell wall biosynthesis